MRYAGRVLPRAVAGPEAPEVSNRKQTGLLVVTGRVWLLQ